MITVTAAIIERQGTFLAARKRAGLDLAGCWEFPGGKLEPGETPESCLARELNEEFGIRCTIGPFLAESVYDYGDKTIRLLGYHVRHEGGELLPTDHDEIRWLPVDRLLDLNWAPADMPLVRVLQGQRAEKLTQDYYQLQAEQYVRATLDADLEAPRRIFLELLPADGHILDVGCGSGRDSRHFRQLGHQVTAIEPAPELARRAAAIIGQPVLVKRAQEIDDRNGYDGIWACASLVHLPTGELESVVGRLVSALRAHGILYLSFPLDATEGFDDSGRYYNGCGLKQLQLLLAQFPQLSVLSATETAASAPQHHRRWLNLFSRKRFSAQTSGQGS